MLRGREVSKSIATLGLTGALLLGGCQALEVDQVAQQSLIGLKERDIRACLGPPHNRAPAGQGTEIWTYADGEARGYGPQWALLLNANVPPLAWPGRCQVKLVMTEGRVTQATYAAGDGEPLPLGQECLFPVEACVKAP
jgi:hypothetical protein